MRTREQVRATLAYHHVEGLQGSKKAKPYGRMAHKLPLLIRQAGLAQALVFAKVKGTDGGDALLGHLGAYLKEVGLLTAASAEALLAKSREAELIEYVQLTREVQAALLWYKRYAQSVLGIEQGEDEG